MRMPILSQPFSEDTFSLDASGIAGFFGGEEAFAAMISVHLIPARRWMGWYNSPGSYFVAKKYGTLPKSVFWDGLFPGPSLEPAELLELDNKRGMRYTGVYSGTQLPTTGHLSYLLSSFCASHKTSPAPLPPGKKFDDSVSSKGNQASFDARVPHLDDDQPRHRNISITVVQFANFEEWEQYPTVPDSVFTTFTWSATAFILLTQLFSVAAAVLSALYGDWYSFSMIILGTITNGITCLVLGSGVLTLKFPSPSSKSPPGDGVLFNGESIILLQGGERIVSAILHSRYRLQYETDPNYHKIGLCSVILLAQFLFQLFLIPQGGLIGQILFIATLAMSWICNGYLASFDSEELQTALLFKLIKGPQLHKFAVDKWSIGVAFTMFYFQPKNPRGMLNELIPNNTPAWDLWKQCVCAAIKHNCRPSEMIKDSGLRPEAQRQGGRRSTAEALRMEFDALSDDDREFVTEFLQQADDTFDSIPDFKKNAKFVPAQHEVERTVGRGYHDKKGKKSSLPT